LALRALPVDSGYIAKSVFARWTINSGSAEALPGDGEKNGSLVRVNFTADDLARTRFSTAPPPLMETGLAMIELRRAAVARGRVRTRPWLREAWRTFPSTARPLLDLFGPRGPWPDFMDSAVADLAEGLEIVRSTPPEHIRSELTGQWGDRPGRPPAWLRDLADGDREALEVVVRALRGLHDAVVAPRWDNVVSSFHADVARRMPVLAVGGLQTLFGTLHQQLQWRNEGLQRPGYDREFELHGGGLMLIPSAFWTGPPVFSIDDREHCGGALIYAAQPSGYPSQPGQLPGPDGDPLAGTGRRAGSDSLGALLGPTRAAVLRALREPHGTAALAGAVGISPASASEHAKVLRDANLIETRREGRSVRHSLTPLGRTMLGHLRHAAEEPGTQAG
jgi:DNA-binding transcriptional ArsR family regulator